MQVIYTLQDLKQPSHPVALTIGMYDGMHLGHQAIFHHMCTLTKPYNGTNIVITFTSHPLERLKPGTIVPKIIPLEEKLKLFKQEGMDIVVLLDFTEKLREQSYEAFFEVILKKISFDYLVLGKGATIGKGQEGTEDMMKAFGKTKGFSCMYLIHTESNGKRISSKRIREALKEGHFEEISTMLGRPYALYAPCHVDKLQEVGDNLLKLTFGFDNLCEIPSGYYLVNLITSHHSRQAIAYLTLLQTPKNHKIVDLEIFSKGSKAEFMNSHVTIEFTKSISPTTLSHVSSHLEITSSLLDKLDSSSDAF